MWPQINTLMDGSSTFTPSFAAINRSLPRFSSRGKAQLFIQQLQY